MQNLIGSQFHPLLLTLKCIVLLTIAQTHFELKSQVIQLLPSFHGFERGDPYIYVKIFLEIFTTFRFQNFTNELVCLHLFPFSLKDKAKAWLKSLFSRSITFGDIHVTKFLSNLFPISNTNDLREIIDFYQEYNEKFYQNQERFKDNI